MCTLVLPETQEKKILYKQNAQKKHSWYLTTVSFTFFIAIYVHVDNKFFASSGM
jgi:hypothetical protein